jgi:predicted transcriptional regulator
MNEQTSPGDYKSRLHKQSPPPWTKKISQEYDSLFAISILQEVGDLGLK